MITSVILQLPGWADRTDGEIALRLGQIIADNNNLLHGFAPSPAARRAQPRLQLVFPRPAPAPWSGLDRRIVGCATFPGDRRVATLETAPPPPSWIERQSQDRLIGRRQ